ncbi:hypothetical protein TKK_0004135 [Trichogramma kaykai]|uniref:Uncharacterized protein n=1 Tax=Trichogramma kaykai TaxID=54128 RepID=A0ABD2XLG1_9HYME
MFKMGLLKSCSFLNLRQGTILIAILQLVLSTVMLNMLILGQIHESCIQDLIARDTEDVLEREALEEITSKHINSQRMEQAHHNANVKMYMIYLGFAVLVVHMLTTILLLYAAVMNLRSLMTPWMMVMMTMAVALFICLFLPENDPILEYAGLNESNYIDRFLLAVMAFVCFFTWFVVYSWYRDLDDKKDVVIHEVHATVATSSSSSTGAIKKMPKAYFELLMKQRRRQMMQQRYHQQQQQQPLNQQRGAGVRDALQPPQDV